MAANWKHDLHANRGDLKGAFVVLFFRLAAAVRGSGDRPRLVAFPLLVAYKFVVGWLIGVDIPVTTRVGYGFRLQHAYGVVIHPAAVIGANCRINHGVTIGIRGRSAHAPVLGDHVAVGSGAQILGPIHLGNRAVVGAGAIVTHDVPEDYVAVNMPANIRPHN